MITQRYNYTPISRATIDGVRHYCLPDGQNVPSVTTILSATKPQADRDALANWRRSVGEQRAQQITTESAGLGTLVHKHVENFLQGIGRPAGNNTIHILGREMADQIIAQGLPDVTEIWGMEVPLYCPGLYAGTTDLVGMYKGVPAIMDHKTSKLMKKPEWMVDYFLQCIFYATAHNEVHGTKIRTGALFMVDRNKDYKTFVIEGAEWDRHETMMLQRLEQYYELNDTGKL